MFLLIFFYFGLIAADKNIAKWGIVSQSDHIENLHADRAVDGNTNGDLRGAGSVTHTRSHGNAAWWRLDFHKAVDVSKILIWNRVDCCSYRLNGVRLTIDGRDFAALHTKYGNPNEIKVNKALKRIQIYGSAGQPLSLAEVEVFSHCSECSSNQYQVKSCSSTQDTVCSNCRTCNRNQYQVSPCSSTKDRVCSSCRTCSSNQYQVSSCSGTRDRVCSNCRTCNSHQYQVSSCSGTQDRVCSDCKTCNSKQYQLRSCSSTQDRLCASCKTCNSNEWEARSCSRTQNRVCNKCKACNSNEYQTGSCSGTNNTACASCTICASNQFASRSCSGTQDRVCANCTRSCSSNEYESTECSIKHDRVCSTCSTCNSGEFISKPCMNSTNTVCSPCSTCSEGEYTVEECSETKDTVCEKYLQDGAVAEIVGNTMGDCSKIVHSVNDFHQIHFTRNGMSRNDTRRIFVKEEMDDAALVGGVRYKLGTCVAIIDAADSFRENYIAIMELEEDFREPIILDVGGQLFTTSLSTLRSTKGTFFEKMFRKGANTTISANGTYFIDRDPSTFGYILDYLRTGDLLVESGDVNVRMQVLDDAEYFKLPNALQDYLRWSSVAGIDLWFSEVDFINDLLKKVSKKMGGLLFQASKDGDAVSTFHSRCDNKGPSVVIVETKSGNVFGGYTSTSWSTSGGYAVNAGAFLFRLRPSMKRYDQRITHNSYAIYRHSSVGPVFGNGHTLYINNCMGVATCYVSNTAYNIPTAYELNDGERFFRIKDYAVVQAKAL